MKNLNNYIILRPYQIWTPPKKISVPITINSCIKNLKFPCTLGNQERDFLYVDDFIDLIIKIIRSKILSLVFLMLDRANQFK